ncbi:MAG: hypothetical protein JRJ84_03960 [Deltaproteobacteria bacterium]|nr:hypothetical protein [Deltaproteobacteria bacterium]
MSRFLRWLFATALLCLTLSSPAIAQEWTVAAEPVVLEDAPPLVPEDWERVSAVYLEVYGSSDSLPVLLELSRHGSRSLPALAELLGVAIGRTVHVVVAPTQQAFFDLQPGSAPEWADGTAYPSLGHIFLRRPGIRGPQRPLQVVFDHELVHVLLGRAFAPQHPPRWLQEGVAQVFAGEYGPDTTREIARGAAGPGLYTLEQLTLGFPSDPRSAQLAYAQSADFVSWMRAEYGDEALREVVHQMRGGADVRGAIRAATGVFLEDVDALWRGRVERGSSDLWLSVFSTGDIWWAMAALFAAVGLLIARWRIRRRMAAMARQERMRDALLRALWHRDDPLG